MISTNILQSVRNVSQRLLDFNEKKSTVQDAIDTILVPHEIDMLEEGNRLTAKNGEITLDNITFAYDGRGNVFENLSLTIKA